MYNFNIEKLHDKIWIFKKALPNPEKFVDYFKNNRDWMDWYTFGTMSKSGEFTAKFDNFPNEKEWNAKKEEVNVKEFSKINNFENTINDVFYYATKMFVESNNISSDNWIFQNWDIAKYNENLERPYAMMHHTDYQRESVNTPGRKFKVTGVFYLNDDYEGGEIHFKILNSENVNIVEKEYVYKPEAGDFIVFPSGHPFYHGVKATTKGEKYIVRTYWRYSYPGSDIWWKLENKYAESWEEMEQERIKFIKIPENMKVLNNIIFFIPFEEYYKKEISEL